MSEESSQLTPFFADGTIWLYSGERPYLHFNLNGQRFFVNFDIMSLYTPLDNILLDDKHNEIKGEQAKEFSNN